MTNKMQLSRSRMKLIELMQLVNFGRMKQVHIRLGEPVFDPPPIVIQDLKICGNNHPRLEIHLRDFTLKQAHVELFQHFDEIKNGIIDELEFRCGLPQMLKVNRAVA